MDDAQVMHGIATDDAYEVDQVLRQGPSGTTELVHIRGGDGSAALVRKKIPRELANRRVWATLADIDCPRLPNVIASYELPDCFVVVYTFVEGQSLDQLVGEEGFADDPGRAVSIICDVAEAAGALHAAGVVHRDITPGNIVVSSDGAHLLDLGISRVHTQGATRDTTLLGTRDFASPEQYGFGQTDARSDVYSMGCVLEYMLVGSRAFSGGPRRLDTSATGALEQVAARARSFEPSACQQSAAEFAYEVRAAYELDKDAAWGNAGAWIGPGAGQGRGTGGTGYGAAPGTGGTAGTGPTWAYGQPQGTGPTGYGAGRGTGPTGYGTGPTGYGSTAPAQAPAPTTLGGRLARAKDDWFDGLRRASQPREAVAILLLVCSVFFGLLFAWVGFWIIAAGTLTAGLFSLSWGLSIVYAFGYQLSSAILRAGDYGRPGAVRLYLLRLARCVGVFAVTFLALIIISGIFGI